MVRKFDILYIASADYDEKSWVNAQHIAKRLGEKGFRVLYVNSLGLRAPSTNIRDIKKIFKKIKNFLFGMKNLDKNVFVITPLILPLRKFQIIEKINNFFLTIYLRYYMKKLCFNKIILWIFLPTAVNLMGKFNEKMVVYHCVDEYSANPMVNKSLIKRNERALLKKAEIVFVTSRQLYQTKKQFARKIFYLPNVADTEYYQKFYKKKTLRPIEFAQISSPIIGFIGNLTDYKIDIKLLTYTAKKLKNFSFVFIGKIGGGAPDTDVSSLLKLNNVYYLGEKRKEELPLYVKYFNVGLIPFNINRTTTCSFPMKFFEYLAMGKPVVSTKIKGLIEFQIRKYDKLVYWGNRGNFVEMIKKAIQENNKVLENQRIILAKQYSWQKRIDEILKIINKFYFD